MTLIDDARRLADADPIVTIWTNTGDELACFACGESEPHAPDCPWLRMPAIVAALEVAERVTDEMPFYDEGPHHFCFYCSAPDPTLDEWPEHKTNCKWQALVAALTGEGAKA